MKKVLMSTIVLTALFMVLISPVKAITKEDYTSYMELELKDPGKRWVSEEGIFQIRNSYWNGTVEGTLGTEGTYEAWVSLSINLATGDGTLREKWLITITSQGTLAGTSRGEFTMPQFSGTFEGTCGTGDFEGVKIMGSFEGFHPIIDGLIDLEHIVVDAEGTKMYP
jgi:hypothetical protein